MRYYIKTFGCQQNVSDSERIESSLIARTMTKVENYEQADYVVINTCMVRRSAEDRAYGLVQNLKKIKKEKLSKHLPYKIIITGCMVGLAHRDKTGKYLQKLRELMPDIDEFIPIEEVGFDHQPLKSESSHALIPISNGCNNFCTYCIVPYTRGCEISRPYEDILKEAKELKKRGYKSITLLGQNVNSYGADLIHQSFDKLRTSFPISKQISNFKFPNSKLKPIYVKHLGHYRIPTLFPYLLEDVARIGFEKVDFLSSNPWDFSDELIDVIARNKNITRTIHLPIQSGDSNVLKRMNRWYTAEQYFALISKLKTQIPEVQVTTDIIVGFCGETDEEFNNTVKLCKQVCFEKAYISMYSPRPMTTSAKLFKDDVLYLVKKKRWQILEDLINKNRSAFSS